MAIEGEIGQRLAEMAGGLPAEAQPGTPRPEAARPEADVSEPPQVDSADTRPRQAARTEEESVEEQMPAWAEEMMRQLTEQNRQLRELVEAQGQRIGNLEQRVAALEGGSMAATRPASARGREGGRLRRAGRWAWEAPGRAWEATGGRFVNWVRDRFRGVNRVNLRQRAAEARQTVGGRVEGIRSRFDDWGIPVQTAAVVGGTAVARTSLENALTFAGAAAGPVAAGGVALGFDGVRALRGGRRGLYESAAQQTAATFGAGLGTESEREAERNRWRGMLGLPVFLLRRLGVGVNALRSAGVQVVLRATRDRAIASEALSRAEGLVGDNPDESLRTWVQLNISGGTERQILDVGRALARLRAFGERTDGGLDYGDSDVYGEKGSYNPNSRIHRFIRGLPVLGGVFGRLMHEVNPNHRGAQLQQFHEILDGIINNLDTSNPVNRRLMEDWRRSAGIDVEHAGRGRVVAAVGMGALGTLATAGLMVMPDLWRQAEETFRGVRGIAEAELGRLGQGLQGPPGPQGPAGPAGPEGSPGQPETGGGTIEPPAGSPGGAAGEEILRHGLDDKTLWDYTRDLLSKPESGVTNLNAGTDAVKDVVLALNRNTGVDFTRIGSGVQFGILTGTEIPVELPSGISGWILSDEAMVKLGRAGGEVSSQAAAGGVLNETESLLWELNTGLKTASSLTNEELGKILALANS